MTQINELAGIFKALGDPNRLAILQVIRKECGPDCKVSADEAGNNVSAIAEQIDLSLSTVSHHLKELKIAGLIQCQKRGQWVYCSPNDDVLKQVGHFLSE